MGHNCLGMSIRDWRLKPALFAQIQAHGGGIIKVNSTFFWYGESYKRPLLGDFLSEGVNMYSSTDLMVWQFEGLVFNATRQMRDMPVEPPFRLERPKVRSVDRLHPCSYDSNGFLLLYGCVKGQMAM